MISFKQVCQGIGVNTSAPVSVMGNFFGFFNNWKSPKEVSLRTQLQLLQGKHVHANFIFVGDYSSAETEEVDFALQRAREIYSQINLGIGKVEWYGVSAADAGGRDNINDDAEAEALTNEYTIPNHALDIFIVKTYSGSTIGLSRVDGPCDKSAKGMNGSVVAIESTLEVSGQVVAHEAAHYLGIDGHVGDGNNLMFASVPNGCVLTASQGNNMKDHCFVNNGV